MILQSLYHLYDRLAEDEKYQLPIPGYSLQKIALEVVLEPNGKLHQLADIRQSVYKINAKGENVLTNKKTSRLLLVLGGAKPSGSGINPCFLWDNPVYTLGYGVKDIARTKECFQAFCEKHLSFEAEINHPDYSALCRFLETWNPDEITEENRSILENLDGGFVLFRMVGSRQYLHETPVIKEWWHKQKKLDDEVKEEGDICLISGKQGKIALTHDPAIKGVMGAQSSGAKIVTFNCKSFESYAKSQGENAPISEEAAFRYCNALNALLSSNDHCFRLGDTTVVFWTEKPNKVADICSSFFEEDLDDEDENSSQDELPQDEKKLREIKAFWKAARQGGTGSIAQEEQDCPFYILGLSPNVSRLSVRFWMVSTAGKILENLLRYREELEIIKGTKDKMSCTVRNILRQTAREVKDISPVLEGPLMRTVLTGAPYPVSLITQILSRLRIDGNKNSLRAAVLKAFLIRNHKQTITMALDETIIDKPYLLGRLFAVLEKIQQDSLGKRDPENFEKNTQGDSQKVPVESKRKLNASVSDKYYGAASTTPGIVFPRLLYMVKHHLAKLSEGHKIYWDRKLGDIIHLMDAHGGYPARLTLKDQGLFSLGYYHQKQDFYKTKEKSTNETPTEK